jgi:hypothetical protein
VRQRFGVERSPLISGISGLCHFEDPKIRGLRRLYQKEEIAAQIALVGQYDEDSGATRGSKRDAFDKFNYSFHAYRPR